jgi:hypothetical protein
MMTTCTNTSFCALLWFTVICTIILIFIPKKHQFVPILGFFSEEQYLTNYSTSQITHECVNYTKLKLRMKPVSQHNTCKIRVYLIDETKGKHLPRNYVRLISKLAICLYHSFCLKHVRLINLKFGGLRHLPEVSNFLYCIACFIRPIKSCENNLRGWARHKLKSVKCIYTILKMLSVFRTYHALAAQWTTQYRLALPSWLL